MPLSLVMRRGVVYCTEPSASAIFTRVHMCLPCCQRAVVVQLVGWAEALSERPYCTSVDTTISPAVLLPTDAVADMTTSPESKSAMKTGSLGSPTSRRPALMRLASSVPVVIQSATKPAPVPKVRQS